MYLECREYGIVPEYGISEILVRSNGLGFAEPFLCRLVHLCPYFIEQVDFDFGCRMKVPAVYVQQGTPQHLFGKVKLHGDAAIISRIQSVDYQSKAAPSAGAFTKKPLSQFRKFLFCFGVGSSSRPLFAGSGSFFGLGIWSACSAVFCSAFSCS